MAETHIAIDPNKDLARDIRRGLELILEGRRVLNDALAVFATMKDGDGSQASHFTYATSKLGTDSDAKTKAAWDELNSVAFKLNTVSGDPAVEAVGTAIDQANAKLG